MSLSFLSTDPPLPALAIATAVFAVAMIVHSLSRLTMKRWCLISPLNDGDNGLLVTPSRIEIWISPHREGKTLPVENVTLSIGFMDQSRASDAALLALQLAAEWPIQSLSCDPEFESLITPSHPQLTPELRELLNKSAAVIGGSWSAFNKV